MDISGFDEFADELDEFADNLRSASESVEDELDDVLDQSARSIRDQAKRNAPEGEKHGKRAKTEQKLKDSFKIVEYNYARVEVVNDAGHAVPQEFGSSPHPIKADEEDQLHFFWKKKGTWVETESVQHPGNDATWFMRKAVRNEHEALKTRLRKAGRRILEEAAGE